MIEHELTQLALDGVDVPLKIAVATPMIDGLLVVVDPVSPDATLRQTGPVRCTMQFGNGQTWDVDGQIVVECEGRNGIAVIEVANALGRAANL